ncbi:heme lyase CcmF/NrfE family subunit [uncultured Azohydromonas sp.]|uniref:heme lyase CcmF/NrfE family subunit n=1 Tax=uncultured Azohydromonas sp. TaxID=487342 RepID=UPI00263894D7|nr:heme lyase CcmF/NrfE family subunit [uncultured Azohydromonas sp.]
MIPELGHFALILALPLALALGVLPLLGARYGSARLMAVARPAALAQGLCMALALGTLVHAFATTDFSVRYVAEHANRTLPLHYRVAGTWGGHEGSLLLWVGILAGWIVAVALGSRGLPRPFAARVLAVLGLVEAGFIAFILLGSNPFERGWPAPADGRDLNPLLQDPGMVLHPPLLYMGYVGFSVAFAFALAALIEGRFDAVWTRWTRPWTLAAWAFLTGGILLGSFWAYYELGWGGWWFWDAVENASLMPWLAGTALIHSLAVSEKRGGFRHWTVLLAILCFSLSLLGTFLVRSGVLSSVHAFAADPRRGALLLAFLAVVVGVSLALYGWRAAQVGAGPRFAPFSRESLLLVNNVLLVSATATVLLGTLYPLVLDALGLGRISVGAPYFEAVIVPLMLPLLFLLGVGPFLAWKRAEAGTAWRRLRLLLFIALDVAVAAGVALALSPLAALGLGLAAWVAGSALWQLAQRVAAAPARTPIWRRLRAVPGGHWGLVLAHLGVGVFVAGVTLVKSLESAHDLSLRPGESGRAGAYVLRLVDTRQERGPNYLAAQARFELLREGRVVAELRPEKRFYVARQMPMTEAAIDRGFTRDVYLSIAEITPDQRWIVRMHLKPFMGWIWAGVLLMALGGAVSAADRRLRRAPVARAESACAPSSTSLANAAVS